MRKLMGVTLAILVLVAVVMLLPTVGASTPSVTTSATWQVLNTTNNTEPTVATSGATMTYDPAINGTLAFIHRAQGDQLWSLKHSDWKRVVLKGFSKFIGVPMGMVYNTVNKEILWFGTSCPLVNNVSSSGQFCIYTIQHGNWTRVTPTDAGPNTTDNNYRFASVVWDAQDNYTLVFGGTGVPPMGSTDIPGINQTWTFVNNTWTQVSTTVAPLPRYGAEIADDGQKIVLFGGINSTGVMLSDTWTYTAGVWTKVVPNQAPPGMQATATNTLVFDPVAGVTFLYGESTNVKHGSSFNVTWAFSAGTWTQLSASVAPPGGVLAKNHEYMAFDPYYHCVVMFVIETQGHNFTWLLS